MYTLTRMENGRWLAEYPGSHEFQSTNGYSTPWRAIWALGFLEAAKAGHTARRLSNGYTYSAEYDADVEEYAGLCQEFPGLSCYDEDEEKALEGIRDLVITVVYDMLMEEQRKL